MSCAGCGGRKTASVEGEPILIGTRNGKTVTARVTAQINNVKPGQTARFTGSEIPGLVAQGLLVPV